MIIEVLKSVLLVKRGHKGTFWNNGNVSSFDLGVVTQI